MVGDRGVQIIPEECRTMKAICAGVIFEAAIIRSPSFSREGLSRTTMKDPDEKASMQDSIGSNSAASGCVPFVVGGAVESTIFGRSFAV